MAEGDGTLYRGFKQHLMAGDFSVMPEPVKMDGMTQAMASLGVTVEEASEAMRELGQAMVLGERGLKRSDDGVTWHDPRCGYCGTRALYENLRGQQECAGCGRPRD